MLCKKLLIFSFWLINIYPLHHKSRICITAAKFRKILSREPTSKLSDRINAGLEWTKFMSKVWLKYESQLIRLKPISSIKRYDLISRLDNASDKNTTSIFLPSYKLLWRCVTKLRLSSLLISILIARSATGNSFSWSLELFFLSSFNILKWLQLPFFSLRTCSF